MDCAILLVGDELLSGHTRDTNGQYLAARIVALGHRVVGIRVAPDEDGPIARDLAGLVGVAHFVVVTGGLGPTHDDRTTEAVAKAFGLGLMVDEASLASLARRYEKRMGGMPEHVLAAARKMVTVPKGATVLPNPVGMAVGYAIPRPPGAVVVLPGVPSEMQAIFEASIAGRILSAEAPLHVEEVRVRLPEAMFGATLARIQQENPAVSIGSYPKSADPVVTLRLRGERDATLRARLQVEAAFREHLVIETTKTERTSTRELGQS